MGDRSATRRGFLALVGAGAVAGCSGLGDLGGGEEPEIDTYSFPDFEHGEDPQPSIAPSVPVTIEPAYLRKARTRTTDLLAELPTPLGPTEIPNGTVRQHLTNAADDAWSHLQAAMRAQTTLAADRALGTAREHARYAAAGWAFVAEGRSIGDLASERSATRATARELREDHDYRGTDPVAAAVVHAEIERALEQAADSSSIHANHEGSELLVVAEFGEAAEAAAAHVDLARHLDSQFTASLPADAGSVAPTLSAAVEELDGALERRRGELPPEPTADDWGARRELLDDLLWEVSDEEPLGRDAAGPAEAVVDGTQGLAIHGAVDRVGQRLDDGEQFTVEDAAGVHEYRSTAYETLETTLAESPATPLARRVLVDAAWRVASADWELGQFEGRVGADRLTDPIVGYVAATDIARATPDACRRTLAALEADST